MNAESAAAPLLLGANDLHTEHGILSNSTHGQWRLHMGPKMTVEARTEEREKLIDQWKFYEMLATVGSATFLEQLKPSGIVRADYLRFSESNSKIFLLLCIVGELQKAGFAMQRWREYSVATKLTDSSAGHGAVETVILESLIDEQSLWQRKLSEALVLLINFSSTNESPYFYHFLLLSELQRCKAEILEHTHFFSHENEGKKRRRDRILKKLKKVEEFIGTLDRCWYLTEPRKHGVASFLQQLKRALPLASAHAKSGLCYTYALGFGEFSENMHFRPVRPNYSMPFDRFSSGFASCGLLAASLLRVAYMLANIVPQSINSFLCTTKDPACSVVGIEDGDFVLVGACALGVVLETSKSKFGYQSYRVKYLGTLPEVGIGEDWFPVFDVSLFMKGKDIRQNLESHLAQLGAAGHPLAPQLSGDPIDDVIRKSIAFIWQKGLAAYFERTAVPKMQDHGVACLDP